MSDQAPTTSSTADMVKIAVQSLSAVLLAYIASRTAPTAPAPQQPPPVVQPAPDPVISRLDALQASIDRLAASLRQTGESSAVSRGAQPNPAIGAQ